MARLKNMYTIIKRKKTYEENPFNDSPNARRCKDICQ